MDNCFLEKLLAKPGKLSPKYNKNTFNYKLILGVSENKTTLDFYTEESGASYQIFTEGGDGTKTICVDEGTTKIVKIEVSAEDGQTTKCYFIEIKRHSARVAIIEMLKINIGILQPSFCSDVFDYSAAVGLKVMTIDFNVQVPDPKSVLKINKETMKPNYSLTLGCSHFDLNVTSPDGSNNKTYTVNILRKLISCFVMITDPQKRLLYEDPISLSPCFYTIKTKSLYSWDILTKHEAEQLVNLNRNEFGTKLEFDESTELAISKLDGQILRSNLTLSEPAQLSNLGSSMSRPLEDIALSNISYSFYPFNTNINTVPEWQASLAMTDHAGNDKSAMKSSEKAITIYFQCRPVKPITDKNQTINHEHPSKKLFCAITLVATAISKQKSESKYHFELAQLLEENYLNGDLFNLLLHKPDSLESGKKCSTETAGRDNKAIVTAKQDEILAICKIHGCSSSPTDTEQLMALDKEYHVLISQNQSARADAIQNLYEWKSKQASQEATMSCQATNEETPIGQAFNKYQAALSLDKKFYLYNFHVGKLLIIQGKYKEAAERLHTALSSNCNHVPSKLCLGLAMSFVPELIKDKINESIFLIADALRNGMVGIFEEMIETDTKDLSGLKLMSDDGLFFNTRNPLISKAILQLGSMLMKNSQTKITTKPSLVIHWALKLATVGWSQIGNGNNLMQFEFTIIECHKYLIRLLHEELEDVPNLVFINRCLWLMNFIKSSSISINGDILQLLEEVCQVPLFFEPANQHFLTFYGETLSRKADQMLSKDSLFISTIELSIKILHFALDVKRENKTEAASKFVKDLVWYKGKNLIIFQCKPTSNKTKDTDNKKTEINKSLPSSSVAKTTTVKPVVNAPKKVTPIPVKKGPVKPANTVNKGGATVKEKEIAKVTSESKEDSTKSAGGQVSTVTQYNRVLSTGISLDPYRIEMALARAYGINKQFHESVKYYKISGIENYINSINDIMQEYIEALIFAEDFNSALDVYYKLPISESNPSFDDGYICGEIVRLLMKLEKYKDKMLIKYASLWAKIFGFGIIDKEITILESKSATETCMAIYAAVHGKNIDDPDLKMFFQSRCWI